MSDAGIPDSQNPYSPNFKFRVNNQEKEMDEWIRGVIKDEKTEKQVRELYEKAYGLDVVKPKLHDTRESLHKIQNEHASYRKEVDQILSLRETDLGEFFKATRVPKEKVFQYVMNELKYMELPPEQKQAIDRQRQSELKVRELEMKSQQMQEHYTQQAVQARTVELSSALERPDVKTVADHFDARVGRPGAFQDEVIKRGQLAYYTTGIDMTADQAVRETLRILGHTAPAPTQAGQAVPSMQAPQAQGKPPVIPTVSGRSTSPARKSPKNLDDLRKMAASMK